MAKKDNISMSVIRRLPRYYRYLSELMRGGTMRISSRELASHMGFTASQIRQDLNCFGGFGQQGYGYDVEYLYNEIGNILGVNSCYSAILIGYGNLGHAVTSFMLDRPRAFKLEAVFDTDPEKIGTEIGGIPVLDSSAVAEYCKENSPEVAILCIPTAAAEQVVATLYNVGIRSFWNFCHYDISMRYDDVTVENVHITDSMLTLCYKITHSDDDSENEAE